MERVRHLWVAGVIGAGAVSLGFGATTDPGAERAVALGAAGMLGLLAALTTARAVTDLVAITSGLAIGLGLFVHVLLTMPIETSTDIASGGHLAFRGITLLSGAAFIGLGPTRGLVVGGLTWTLSVAALTASPMPLLELSTGAAGSTGTSGVIGVAITSAMAIGMFRMLSSSVADLQEQADEAQESAGLAFVDHLTGLANRRQMTIHIQASLTRAVEGGGPDSLVMFDLDRFKAINDTLGHEVGDGVLVRTADAATEVLRDADVLGRWGGEEFLLLLHETPLDEAVAVAERCRRSISAAGDLPEVTASFGVAEIRSIDTLTDAVRRADLALYEAKRTGRDRVVAWSEDRTPPGVGHTPPPGSGDGGPATRRPVGMRRPGDHGTYSPTGRPPR
jgi:diguanylate cyclase (GGDEF)-like protein